MNIQKRIANLEDNLNPVQAIIRWMGEVHQFPTILDYCNFLSAQPEDAYPLVLLPGQVAAAVKRRLAGQARQRIEQETERARKNVAFLFYLHEEMNQQVIEQEPHLDLRMAVLAEKLRSLIHEKHACDHQRVDALLSIARLVAPHPRNSHGARKEPADPASYHSGRGRLRPTSNVLGTT